MIAPRSVPSKKAGEGRKAGIDGFGRSLVLACFRLRALHRFACGSAVILSGSVAGRARLLLFRDWSI
jgi:hypothetical protein